MRLFPASSVLLCALTLAACNTGAGAPEADGWRALQSSDSTGAVVAAFLARDAVPVEGETMPASLYVRCSDGAASVYVDWRAPLVADTADVTYAFDDLPEAGGRWPASADRSAAGVWTDSLALPLFDQMLAHDRLDVTTETTSGVRTRSFGLDGLDDLTGPFREACDLPEADA